ncbi:MAG: serine hydrolase [Planctomycetota bacterium]
MRHNEPLVMGRAKALRATLLGVGLAAALGCHSVPGAGPAPEAEVAPLARHDTQLQAELEAATSDFRGVVGVWVQHLQSGRFAALRADEVFPTASMIKVPILCALYARIDAGELDPHAKLVYDKARLYPGEDLLGSFEDGQAIALDKLVMLMLSMSDNTASLWLQELAGTGTAINAWLDAHGFVGTRMNSRTPGRERDRERMGWGQTTPREMAELLVAIRSGRAASPASCEEMHRALTRSFWNKEALSAIPPDIAVMSKQGAVNRSRSEVLLVHARHGDYVLCVITKEQADESWGHDNEGFALLRALSRLVFEHFEGARPND